jgi:transposase-like protein
MSGLRDASSLGSSGTERAVPFHCPYCGDENLWPHEAEGATHGAWECRACQRAFSVRLLGLLRPEGVVR